MGMTGTGKAGARRPPRRVLCVAVLLIAALAIASWWMPRTFPARSTDPMGRGVSAYRDGDWRTAEVEARALLKSRSADLGALRLLARAAARQGRHDTAEAIYRRLGTGRMEAEDLFLLGRGLLRRGQSGPALAALGAARDAQPDHAETLEALASFWAGKHSLTDALDAADRLSRLPGWEVRGFVLVGRLRLELLDPAGAVAALREALNRDPRLDDTGTTPREAETLLVRGLLQSGRAADALDRLRRLDVSLDPRDAEIAWLSSRAWLQEGRIGEARAALERAGNFGARDPMLREPAPFVGARTCAPCHPDQFQSQQDSRHARTLQRADSLAGLPWPAGPVVDRNNPGVAHRLVGDGNRVEAATAVGGQTFRAVVEYALGSNHQGQSFLARDDRGQAYELRVSRYPAAPEWDRTMEHPAVPPNAAGYLGRPVSAESFRKCLHCHATNFQAAREPEGRPEARDHGIGCERCHGPGGYHATAIGAQFPQPAIARPRLARPSEVVALCAECHTAPASTTPSDPGFVRYQVSGLVLSRCYIKSGEGFSCVTCHDPHQDAETASTVYVAKCLECHRSPSTPAASPGASSGRAGPPCPVNPRGDCISCHMPTVKDAVPRTAFSDHWIRVRRP
jgi:tetratricopeptide (TPR) repeat protein